MQPDPVLGLAVDAFCDALGPRVRDLAGSVAGIDGEQVESDVQVEAYNLAAAFIDCDGLHTDQELWAFIATFGPRFGGSLAKAVPADVRSARLVTGRKSFLTEPSDLLEVLLSADARDGSDLASLYYDRALAIAFAVASIDQMAAPVELAAIESFRGRILDRISKAKGVDRQQVAHDAGASRADAATEAAEEDERPPARPVDEVLAELDSLIGLDGVKAEVKLVADLTRVQLLRAERGLPVLDQSRHLVFSGNPGTGKTTVARLLAEIYRSLGVVAEGHLVEVDRSGLVAGFVGQTAPKVVAAFDEADEGVLLIDEAYSLVRGSESDFGREAIDTIVKLVEDRRDRIVVIMAGYPDEMEQLVSANPGLRSRFPKTIHFPDYSSEELIEIFQMRCDKGGYRPDDEALEAVRAHLDAVARDKGFGNGRVARNIFEAAVARQASRIVEITDPSDVELTTLERDDIPPFESPDDDAGDDTGDRTTPT
ncbi:AAA family ATPase [Actinospongicola halichondriae]|uniref:AAA family ATPase n=1 Tax=Actinospongicola halichondriae TaxID=3236844 RepID=UPI003D51C36C